MQAEKEALLVAKKKAFQAQMEAVIQAQREAEDKMAAMQAEHAKMKATIAPEAREQRCTLGGPHGPRGGGTGGAAGGRRRRRSAVGGRRRAVR